MFKSQFQIIIEKTIASLLTVVKILIKSRLTVPIEQVDGRKPLTILTNGPSLIKSTEALKDVIKDHEMICVNHFPTSHLYEELKPRYYVTTAPDLWLEDIEERFIIQSNKLFDVMSEKTTWPLMLLLPFEAKKYQRWQKNISTNPNITIVYINNTPVDGFPWFMHWCFRKKLGMPRPHNVLIPCLTLGLSIGFKKINVLGADHSWLPEISVTQDNQVLIRQKHFYDEGTAKALPQDKKGKGERKLYELLEKYLHTFEGYFTLQSYAAHCKTHIINVTENSFIDAFEKKTIEEFKNYISRSAD